MDYFKGEDGFYVYDKVKTRHDAVNYMKMYKKFRMWYRINEYLIPTMTELIIAIAFLILIIRMAV